MRGSGSLEAVVEEGHLPEALVRALEYLATGVDLIGVAIVLWGFALALFGFLASEFGRLNGRSTLLGCRNVRLQLGTYILTAIEFMIASDIINTVISRELVDLGFVAALVLVRTAISYFLGKELTELKEPQS